MVSWKILRRLNPLYLFKFVSVEESKLSKNFNNVILTFGNALSGDEKLFRYTGKSGFVLLGLVNHWDADFELAK